MNYQNPIWLPIYTTFNKQTAYNAALNGCFVVDVEEFTDLPSMPNILNASMLLPPYPAIAAILDGDMDIANQLYSEYLCNNDVWQMIQLVFMSALKGKTFMVYFGGDAKDMPYPSMLLAFISNMTGVTWGTETNCGYVMPEFIGINLASLLVNENIDPLTFYTLMPIGMDIIPEALIYLDNIFRPALPPDYGIADLNKVFKDVIKNVHTTGKMSTFPFVRKSD